MAPNFKGSERMEITMKITEVIVAVCGIYACFIVADWKRIAAGTVLFLLLLLPQLYYNFRTIGYPVPELRYGAVLKKAGILPPGTPEVEIPESAL